MAVTLCGLVNSGSGFEWKILCQSSILDLADRPAPQTEQCRHSAETFIMDLLLTHLWCSFPVILEVLYWSANTLSAPSTVAVWMQCSRGLGERAELLLWSTWTPYTDTQTPRPQLHSASMCFFVLWKEKVQVFMYKFIWKSAPSHKVRLSTFHCLFCFGCWHCDAQACWVHQRFHSFYRLIDIVCWNQEKYPCLKKTCLL